MLVGKCTEIKSCLSNYDGGVNKANWVGFFLTFFTAFIQSDTILEVLHFGEGSLLQVRPFVSIHHLNVNGGLSTCLRNVSWHAMHLAELLTK